VILLDDRDRVLMIKVRDDAIVMPGSPASAEFWILVGGDVEWGESWEEAALRSVFEETGIGELELGPCVWTLDREVLWSGQPVRVLERYFLGRAPAAEAVFDNGREHKWWSQPDLELASGRQAFRPEGLPELLADVLAAPPDRPIEL
jgi:ADP-ribose pyrophosphatase YjhB (NUDIX family)